MGRAQHSPRLRSLSNSPLLPTEFFATKAGSPAHNEASLLLGCMCRRESGRLATVGSDDGSSFVVDGEGEPAGFVERSGEKGPAADRPLPHRLAVVEFQSDGRCVEGHKDDCEIGLPGVPDRVGYGRPATAS